MHLATLLWLLVASAHALDSSPELSSSPEARAERQRTCATLGFDSDALDCRLCDDFATFLGGKKTTESTRTAIDLVTTECRDCCADFSKVLEAEGRRYPKVALVVNRFRLKRYPNVANFLEHQATHMQRLEVIETSPRLPMLQFFDPNGDKVEEISVAHWDETSIAEFVANKLLPEEPMVETPVEAVLL